MSEPKGCPTPGACSAAAQIAELTKERDHWHRAFRNITAAGDTLLEIERQRVRDALENSARLIEERNQLANEFGAEHRLYLTCKHDLAAARNEWRSIATDNLSALQTATARIADAQAREEKLRAALVEIRDGKFPKDGDEYADDSMRMFALAAIALPTDTSALDTRLAEERERCAKELEGLDHMNFHRAAYYIRRMK